MCHVVMMRHINLADVYKDRILHFCPYAAACIPELYILLCQDIWIESHFDED